ncbi:MAG: serine/threonine-protein kinase [Planctomycetota bacterium]
MSKEPDTPPPARHGSQPGAEAEAEAPTIAEIGAPADTGAPGDASLADTIAQMGLRAGGTVGPYKLLERLGEGGFGVVWAAEQTVPVRRRVAVKVIKPGMDSAAVIARFEAERQALAVMDHPGIARVLDAGATAEALPYFVMELVKGEPLNEFCDRANLTLEQRVELIARVCEAVQHAHSKGVIHRDLKPGNILVGYQDGEPTPKVIDFGVAKALTQQLTERTLYTDRGQLIGTPEYMSPEQADMAELDVDTRSDVYSLGVVLYEVLTGELPFDPRALRSAGYAEIQRIIREVDPPKPSTRLSTRRTSSEPGEPSAERRPTPDHRARIRALRRDLDWIVMRCLDKNRERRYATATELAADLNRFLRGEAVLAGPPTALYRVSKFARRNKAAVVTLGAVFAVLAVGVAATSAGLLWALRERERAQAEADLRGAAFQFLTDDVIAAIAPDELGGATTLQDALLAAAPHLEARFADNPRARALIHHTIGVALNDLEALPEAERHLKAAMALREQIDGPSAPSTLDTLAALVAHHTRAGMVDQGLAHAERLRDARYNHTASTPEQRIDADMRLANFWKDSGRLADAETAFRASIADLQDAELDETSLAADVRHDLGVALMRQAMEFERDSEAQRQRYRDAAEELETALKISRRVNGADAMATLTTASEHATAVWGAGDLDRAVELYEQVLEAQIRRLGEAHPRTAQTLVNSGVARYRTGQHALGVERLTRGHALYIEIWGPDHAQTRNVKTHLQLARERLAAAGDDPR